MALAESAEITFEELQLAARNHALPLEALRHPITPLGLHYLLIHFDIPDVDEQAWRLRVGGRVARSLTLTLDELQVEAGSHAGRHDGVRRQRPRSPCSARGQPAVAHGGGRHRRVDGHAARPDPRGGRSARREPRGRLHRPRSRHPGRRRAPLRTEPAARRCATRGGAPRLRGQRPGTPAAARLPAAASWCRAGTA